MDMLDLKRIKMQWQKLSCAQHASIVIVKITILVGEKMKILNILEAKKVSGGECSATMKQAMLQEMKKAASSAGYGSSQADEARMKKTINSMCS
jgi:hypothetical protein